MCIFWPGEVSSVIHCFVVDRRIHVRRTDKVGAEAAFHSIDEYMAHVDDYYNTVEKYRHVDRRRVYIATDDPSVITDAQRKYVSPQPIVPFIVCYYIKIADKTLLKAWRTIFERRKFSISASKSKATDIVVYYLSVTYFSFQLLPFYVTVTLLCRCCSKTRDAHRD